MTRGRRRTKAPGFPAADGLLTRFIRDTLGRHVEPTRRGTPRGAPVGFSRQKLAAALFALTSTDVKQTARAIGVSYGVVRKWRTQPAFKALVERLEDDFVDTFCPAVDASSDAREPLWATARPEAADLDPLVDVLQERCGQWIAANVGDAARYGPRVIGKLTAQLLDQPGGVGRPWRLAILQAVAPRWAPAGPDAALGPLDARRLRAWLAMLRFIVVGLESDPAAGRRTLARVYLRWLHHQLLEPALATSRRPGPSGQASKGRDSGQPGWWHRAHEGHRSAPGG